MDVKTAHLNAPIVCELYIEQPEGYGRKGPNGEKLVCRLKKFLSGLKQSGQNWNCLLRGYLTQEGFVQSQLIRVFMLKVLNFGQVIAIVWVDDIVIAGINTDVLRFKMKDLGVLSWFLGIQFKCKDDFIEMSQSKFVEKILERFNLSDCKPKAVPCELGANKASTVNETEFENVKLLEV